MLPTVLLQVLILRDENTFVLSTDLSLISLDLVMIQRIQMIRKLLFLKVVLVR